MKLFIFCLLVVIVAANIFSCKKAAFNDEEVNQENTVTVRVKGISNVTGNPVYSTTAIVRMK